MARLLSLVPVLLICASGCVQRERLNENCQWTGDTAVSLDSRDPAAQRHLADDAAVAEELAIRYADVRRGHRSGHYDGPDAYGQTREQCMAALFSAVAVAHGVDAADVRGQLGRRAGAWDSALVLLFAAVYALAAGWIAGRIHQALPLRDWPWASPAAMLVASIAVSVVGLLAGDIGSGIAESVRVGSQHLSYRAARIPWQRHHEAVFGAGLVLFWMIASVRWFLPDRHEPVRTHGRTFPASFR